MTLRITTTAAILWLAAACGGPSYDIRGTDQAIGADAELAVDEREHGNREVSLSVEHLPPATRVSNDRAARYVVWFVEPNGDPHKAGFLEYDDGSRKGKLETVTTLDRFRVVVTSETDREADSPQGPVVLRQQVGS